MLLLDVYVLIYPFERGLLFICSFKRLAVLPINE